MFVKVHKANFNNDQYVRQFGLSISNEMVTIEGRVLPAPKIQYGGKVRNRVVFIRLKASFNNVFTLKIRATCPYMLSMSLIRCKNEALKKLHLKSTIKCFKNVKIGK